MGLDMYLSRIVDNGKDGKGRQSYTKTDVMYWRKANAIHQWFVDNVSQGEDDCGVYELTGNMLKQLRNKCEEAINDPSNASEILPTQEGFFFGSTEYDERYFDLLRETVDAIDGLFCEYEPEDWFGTCWYEYHASW